MKMAFRIGSSLSSARLSRPATNKIIGDANRSFQAQMMLSKTNLLSSDEYNNILNDPQVADNYETTVNKISSIQNKLLNHPMYSSLTNIPSLHVLMSSHVFQVWDFMFLVKKMQYLLQNNNCIPWVPPVHNQLTRFVQEIVLCEETDSFEQLHKLTGKESISHLEMYLMAMDKIGLNVDFVYDVMNQFQNHQLISQNYHNSSNNNTGIGWAFRAGFRVSNNNNNNNGLDFKSVIRNNEDITPACLEMFKWNLDLSSRCDYDNLHCICAAFIFGRENIIPPMFEQVIKFIPKTKETELFWLYLERHIEVDGHGEHGDNGTDSHQVLGQNMIKILCNYDDKKWKQCLDIAIKSLELRCNVWDQVLNKIKHL